VLLPVPVVGGLETGPDGQLVRPIPLAHEVAEVEDVDPVRVGYVQPPAGDRHTTGVEQDPPGSDGLAAVASVHMGLDELDVPVGVAVHVDEADARPLDPLVGIAEIRRREPVGAPPAPGGDQEMGVTARSFAGAPLVGAPDALGEPLPLRRVGVVEATDPPGGPADVLGLHVAVGAQPRRQVGRHLVEAVDRVAGPPAQCGGQLRA
jgi:hypothetical protein